MLTAWHLGVHIGVTLLVNQHMTERHLYMYSSYALLQVATLYRRALPGSLCYCMR